MNISSNNGFMIYADPAVPAETSTIPIITNINLNI